jgi:hypothetical protein
VFNFVLAPMLGQASDVYGRKVRTCHGDFYCTDLLTRNSLLQPFLVLSQLVRVCTPFAVMYFMQPQGSITPYFVLRLIDYGFG